MAYVNGHPKWYSCIWYRPVSVLAVEIVLAISKSGVADPWIGLVPLPRPFS